MVNHIEPRKIMTKPLPEILDEIEDSTRLANEAAKDAREATAGVHKAADKAIKEATSVAYERIAKVERSALQATTEVRESAEKAIRTANERIGKVEQNALQAIEEATDAANGRISEVEKNALQAVAEVRKAGEKAIAAIEETIRDMRDMNERITKIEQIANSALQLAELLKAAVMDGVVAVDKRFQGKIKTSRAVPK